MLYTFDEDGIGKLQLDTIECINRAMATMVQAGIPLSEIHTELTPQYNLIYVVSRLHEAGYRISWVVEKGDGIRVTATPLKAVDFL